MSTTASIGPKGTNGTGITEELAKTLHDNLGKTIVVVAEIRSESRGENLKGDEKVNLAIQTIEVIPEDMGAAEHVREVAKVAHYNRKLAEDGPSLKYDGDDIEPKVADVLAAGAQHRPHPYLASTLSTDDTEHGPVCDVCGLLATAAVHSEQTTISDDPDDEDADGDGEDASEDDESPDPGDPAFDAHDYIAGPDDECIECDQPESAAVHETTDAPQVATIPDPFTP